MRSEEKEEERGGYCINLHRWIRGCVSGLVQIVFFSTIYRMYECGVDMSDHL